MTDIQWNLFHFSVPPSGGFVTVQTATLRNIISNLVAHLQEMSTTYR